MPQYISKTKYLEGLICPKLLWYEYNRRDAFPPVDAKTQDRFDQGHMIGETAHKLFPGGIRLERLKDPAAMSEASAKALSLGVPLFEAGFVHKNAYAIADILLSAGKGSWDIVEVKSSTRIKEDYLHDLAFQKYVYGGAGLKINRACLMHIDNTYIRRGDIELDKLFKKEDLTEQADELIPGIEKRIQAMLEIISAPEAPAVETGEQCNKWSGCPLCEVCFTDPEDYLRLKLRRAIQIESHRTGKPHVDREALREFIGRLRYPLYFLDFETISPAIPIYDLTSPYEVVPFQFSLHVQEKDVGDPVHYSFIAPGDVDPRPGILSKLERLLGTSGSIVAYAADYEKRCLDRAADVYPEYDEWFESVRDRFVDLWEPFRRLDFYSPKQNGSTSMKEVLPALTGHGYDKMEISDGETASREYMRVTFGGGADKKDRAEVLSALEKYCALDTGGMVEIINELGKKVGGLTGYGLS